ncbi:MAG TPA: copper resistance protein B [Lysobacter sp.]|nr:copper resistance protein B [Lysobacter sp.]
MTSPPALPGVPMQPRTPIPPITDADRAAAFPVVAGHASHDRVRTAYLRIDRLETDDADGLATEVTGWYGGDIHRAWLRADAHGADGELEDGRVELLYGRLVTPWWDVVGGMRQDIGHGPSRTWAAIGVQGLAPYKFEVRATAYLGDGGRTAARVEAEYDTLLTHRWVLQWRAEAEAFGRTDAALHRGRGLSTAEAGARLRYEVTRGFAPYIGVEVERAFGGTADYRREDGEAVRDTRVVAGLRLWF